MTRASVHVPHLLLLAQLCYNFSQLIIVYGVGELRSHYGTQAAYREYTVVDFNKNLSPVGV
jgi:hypothetical protein